MALPLFLWMLLLTVAFLAVVAIAPRRPASRVLLWIGVIAAIARVVPILIYPEAKGLNAIDAGNFSRAAQAILDGQNVYALGGFVHPYLPFQMYVFAAAKAIADATGWEFFVLIRIPQAAADVATALLVVLGTRALRSREEAWRNGLLYALCPFPVFVATVHGQFDAISTFFTLAAMVLVITPGRAGRQENASAIAVGLGILQKLWPGFLLPLFVLELRGWPARLRYLAISSGLVALSAVAYMLAFGGRPGDFRDQVLRYQNPFPRVGGIVMALDRLPDWVPGAGSLADWWIDDGEVVAVLAVLCATLVVVAKRVPLAPAAASVLVVLFVFVPDGAAYHYTWILPLALVAGHRSGMIVVSLLGAGVYFSISFAGAGAFFTPPEWPGAAWVRRNDWILHVALWWSFAGWAAYAVGRALSRPGWSLDRLRG